MSDPVNHLMKVLGVKPDGALSFRTSRTAGGVQVQVLSQGVVVGGQYLVAANDVGAQNAG